MTLDESTLEHRRIDVGGVTLHVVLAGPEGGPPVVLLHGFPEFWFSWRHQIPALVAAGYRVIVPDQRGYNLSDHPVGVHNYRLPLLVGDVLGLLNALSLPRVALVGHDWGGMVAWHFAMEHPDRLTKLAVLNLPHPVEFRRALKTRRQLEKSWYVAVFQVPVLPERYLAKDDYKKLRRAYKTVRKGAFTEDDLRRYVEVFKRPGVLTAALNWYRAAGRDFLTGRMMEVKRIDTPTLALFGEQDIALEAAFAKPPPSWVPDARTEILPDATHWVQNDAPEAVNAKILEFLASTAP